MAKSQCIVQKINHRAELAVSVETENAQLKAQKQVQYGQKKKLNSDQAYGYFPSEF
jgi:phenylacetate-coenzyme A ligase PaaK-like adenylate-forming protein